MKVNHLKKHLRVLFTFLCCLLVIVYAVWFIYYHFVDNPNAQSLVNKTQFHHANPQQLIEDKDRYYSELTAMDLMKVPEVINRALSAVMFDEPNELILLQVNLLDTAKQINLHPSQIEYINSPQAINFLKFRAKRTWFNQEVEDRYINIQSLDGLLERFPEARGDLYQQATQLIINRDLIIFEIAKGIAEAEQRKMTEYDLESARRTWRESLVSSSND